MLKSLTKGLALVLAVVFLSGCGARTYSQVKERVDQDVVGGNAGYLQGTGPAQDRSAIKKTRKTYVLEIDTPSARKQKKEIDQAYNEAQAIIERAKKDADLSASSSSYQEAASAPVSAQQEVSQTQEYTVQEGDTLQKISKKFYDRYSRWQKIYDANKDKISDPNNIKPGIILTIPQE